MTDTTQTARKGSEIFIGNQEGHDPNPNPPGIDIRTRFKTPRHYEVKGSEPNGGVLDVSDSGWVGAAE
ncbi:MAG: hypothetical protein OEU26_20265 [Candidatus Tectomicrobia bacterium]|nr:hypothetical protein [Candidatus Tectomicrobia bacterium]